MHTENTNQTPEQLNKNLKAMANILRAMGNDYAADETLKILKEFNESIKNH